jgi:hypothetical protein
MNSLAPRLAEFEDSHSNVLQDHVEMQIIPEGNSYQHASAEQSWNRMPILDALELKSDAKEHDAAAGSLRYKFAINASWVVNFFLLAVKIFIVVVTASKAVSASLADSAVDLLSQLILSIADVYMNRHSADYPVGRSRLEALSVIACAFIMSMASVEGILIIYSLTPYLLSFFYFLARKYIFCC